METRNLKRGMTGQDVRELQVSLNDHGYRLPTTGYYGRLTDHAVRSFQARRGLVQDGIVGRRSRKALGLDRRPVYPHGHFDKPDGSSGHPAGHPSNPAGRSIDPLGAASSFLRNLNDLAQRIGCGVSDLLASARKARSDANKAPSPASSRSPVQQTSGKPAPPQKEYKGEVSEDERSQNVKGMRISNKGLKFIYTHETVPEVSNRLHWPKGASGVTLGPGYDMKERQSASIIRDLTAIGVDGTKAAEVAKASGLTGTKASAFARTNKKLVNLTTQQEMQLLLLIVPRYEAIVKRWIRVKLYQHQYDALVCFVYNPGGKFTTVASQINKGKFAEAMAIIEKRNTSGGEVSKALVYRRKDEIALYLHNSYGRLRG